MPFQLTEVSTKKDVTWICDKYKAEVTESYCNFLRKKDIRVFLKRRILGTGIIHTENSKKNNKGKEEKEDQFFDVFLKVNEIEIY